jgi:hypothetical protein
MRHSPASWPMSGGGGTRIRRATTGASQPRWSPPGFGAWPMGACRPPPAIPALPLIRPDSVQRMPRQSAGNSGKPTATTPAVNARVPSSSAEIAAAVPIAGEPFLWEGTFPRAARIRAAKAIYRAYAAQQSIEQSPVDA